MIKGSQKIVVNGQEIKVMRGMTVCELLDLLKESYRSDMLVEINNRFIHEKIYDSTMLQEGDCIEIIHMAMGG